MMKRIIKISTAFFILILGLICTSCYYDGPRDRIEGQGPLVSRTLDIEDFEGISLATSADITIKKGKVQRVEARGQENIIKNLNTEVTGGIWRIKNRRPVWKRHDLELEITVPSFAVIRLGGSGNIKTIDHFDNLDDLELGLSGSGSIAIECDADDIRVRISGSGDVFLDGKAEQIDCTITGSGGINALNLRTEYADVVVSGSGGVKVNASERLDVRISGSGSVVYKGDPRLSSKITGSGSIHNR